MRLARTTWMVFLILALAAAWPRAAAAKPPPKIIIEVGAGHAFSIRLPARQDRGYWSLARPLNDQLLEITGARYQRAANPKQPGVEIWSFRSLAPGLAEIHFIYRPAFGHGQEGLRRTRVYQVMMWDRVPDRQPAPGYGPSDEPDQDPN